MPAATTASPGSLQEGPSVGHKRAAVTGDESIPVENKPAFEKRERARVRTESRYVASYSYGCLYLAIRSYIE